MIINIFVAVYLVLSLFALVIGLYAAYKSYTIECAEKSAALYRRYELEKDFYLVSTVCWLTFVTRVVSIPLFFITVISLILAVPVAMCEFVVFQAFSPFSCAALSVKLFTLFAF